MTKLFSYYIVCIVKFFGGKERKKIENWYEKYFEYKKLLSEAVSRILELHAKIIDLLRQRHQLEAEKFQLQIENDKLKAEVEKWRIAYTQNVLDSIFDK